jgi:hypothetical protein
LASQRVLVSRTYRREPPVRNIQVREDRVRRFVPDRR